jgi:hypothetical protein
MIAITPAGTRETPLFRHLRAAVPDGPPTTSTTSRSNQQNRSLKLLFGYPLVRDFRRWLCADDVAGHALSRSPSSPRARPVAAPARGTSHAVHSATARPHRGSRQMTMCKVITVRADARLDIRADL